MAQKIKLEVGKLYISAAITKDLFKVVKIDDDMVTIYEVNSRITSRKRIKDVYILRAL